MLNQTEKKSMLCPNCRRLINRDEEKCPYCGISHPGSWWKNNRLVSAFSDQEQVLKLIIYTNITMYVLSLLLNPRSLGTGFSPFGFLSPGNKSLFLLGATGTVPILQLHRWWSLLSANYLHGSLLHILFNMFALRQIGPLVIQEYGRNRMFVIYTLGGVGGFVVSFLAGVPYTIGASAAVCALIGAMLYYGKSRGGTYGQNIYSQIGGCAISIFIFGFLVPGINNWGHGGGMAAGALLAYLMGYRERLQETMIHKYLATGCLVATAGVLAWAVLTSLMYVFLA